MKKTKDHRTLQNIGVQNPPSEGREAKEKGLGKKVRVNEKILKSPESEIPSRNTSGQAVPPDDKSRQKLETLQNIGVRNPPSEGREA
jgi:hypothetical protein